MKRRPIFVGLLAYILLGPAFPMLLGVREGPFRAWRMFWKWGSDICEVHYVKVDRGGRRSPLDRFRALGYRTRADAPRSLRFVRDPAAITEIGAKLCRKLGGRADVRVEARCGSPDGWVTANDGRQNLCPRRAGRRNR